MALTDVVPSLGRAGSWPELGGATHSESDESLKLRARRSSSPNSDAPLLHASRAWGSGRHPKHPQKPLAKLRTKYLGVFLYCVFVEMPCSRYTLGLLRPYPAL